jgi:hypothetical protein
MAQGLNTKVFSFKGAKLFARFSEVPESYRQDCFSGELGNYAFCSMKTRLGEVDADVDFYFSEGHLIDIDVYFDPKQVDVMSRAVRKKLGPEAISHEGNLMWFASDKKPYMGNMSDTVIFRPKATKLPRSAAEGTAPLREYSVITYHSLELIRRKTATQVQELDSKADSASKDL